MRKWPWRHIAAYGAAVLVIAGVLTYGLYQQNQKRLYQRYLSGLYTKSYYELIDNMNNLEIGLSKLTVSGGPEQHLELLAGISRLSEQAQESLAQLPVSHVLLSDARNFANQTYDYACMLYGQAAAGTPISSAERQSVEDLYRTSQDLKQQLEAADVSELVNVLPSVETYYEEQTASSGTDQTNQPVEYPTLIYDGPFSDAAQNKAPKGLPSQNADAAQAEAMALRFLGEETTDTLQRQEDVGGSIPCYTFQTSSEADATVVQVSRKGGQVIRVLGRGPEEEGSLSEAECLEIARDLLQRMGYPSVQAAHVQKYAGCYFINFVPIQAGVWLYPDLIKVKVSTQDGSIAGFDATGYYANHVERKLAKPVLAAREAILRAGTSLEIQRVRLALIPTDNRGEQLCYEVTGAKGSDTYMAYINAKTGREEEIFKIIDTANGPLVM